MTESELRLRTQLWLVQLLCKYCRRTLCCGHRHETGCCEGRFSGTLTQNEMVVTRLWVAGFDRRNVQDLRKENDVPHFMSIGEADVSSDFIIPLGLDPRIYNILSHAVALNSTANLRPPKDGSSERPCCSSSCRRNQVLWNHN